MKRLNPKTGKPFELGDIREDGKVFKGYDKKKLRQTGYYAENWRDPVSQMWDTYFQNAKSRARQENIPFDIDIEHIKSLKTDACPVFGIVFDWGASIGRKQTREDVPQLDRIIPELGYVRGNVVFLSKLANRFKNNSTLLQLYTLADWLYEKMKEISDAHPQALAHISETLNQRSAFYSKHRIVSGTRFRQDGNDFNHHSGAVHRIDSGNSTQASSGDSLGTGDKEMGTLEALKSLQNFGIALSAAVSPEPTRSHFLSELRERGLVNGTEPEV